MGKSGKLMLIALVLLLVPGGMGYDDMAEMKNTLNQLVKQNKELQTQMSTITAGLTEMCRAVNIATCNCNQGETGPNVVWEAVHKATRGVVGDPEELKLVSLESDRVVANLEELKLVSLESDRVVANLEEFKLLSLESHGVQNGTVQLTFKFEAIDGYWFTWVQWFQQGNGLLQTHGVLTKTQLANNRYLYQSDIRIYNSDLQVTRKLLAMIYSTSYVASVDVNVTAIVDKGEHSIPEWEHRLTEYPRFVVLPHTLMDEYNISVSVGRNILELVDKQFPGLPDMSPDIYYTFINTTSDPPSVTEVYPHDDGLTVSHVDNDVGDIHIIFTLQKEYLENGGQLSLTLPHIGNEFIEVVKYGVLIDVVRELSMPFVPDEVAALYVDVKNIYSASSVSSVTCFGMGNPSPNITVYKEGKGQREEMEAETLIKDHMTTFKTVVVDDLSKKRKSFGTYVCRASNGYNTIEHRITLQPFRSIKFDERKTGVTTNTTNSIFVSCKASGNPTPQLEIRLGSAYGPNLLGAGGNFTSKIRMKVGSSKVTIRFSPVDRRFDVVYCFAVQRDTGVYETHEKQIRIFPETDDLSYERWTFYDSFLSDKTRPSLS